MKNCFVSGKKIDARTEILVGYQHMTGLAPTFDNLFLMPLDVQPYLQKQKHSAKTRNSLRPNGFHSLAKIKGSTAMQGMRVTTRLICMHEKGS